MDNSIKGTAELYRVNGQWTIILKAPKWVMDDIGTDMALNSNHLVKRGSGSNNSEEAYIVLNVEPKP